MGLNHKLAISTKKRKINEIFCNKILHNKQNWLDFSSTKFYVLLSSHLHNGNSTIYMLISKRTKKINVLFLFKKKGVKDHDALLYNN